MNREDIIRMAQEAGFDDFAIGVRQELLEAFAALVAAAEREACAKACDDVITNDWEGAVDCANAIRARGQA